MAQKTLSGLGFEDSEVPICIFFLLHGSFSGETALSLNSILEFIWSGFYMKTSQYFWHEKDHGIVCRA